jgi:hypothetical protein
MDNKAADKIFLLLAILLGGIVRFLPVFMAGFPVNDGGMFYVMIEELKANHFLLPAFTQYNLAGIPYAYSPFGFYATALISSLFRIPVLDLVRWLPPVVATLALLAFYLLAYEILGSRLQAALAALFYGLVSDSFGWAIMGGGITRSFGLLFLYLTIAFANRLFARTSGLHAILTAIFGALAFLSHPQTGLQAAAACLLLWLFRGRSRRTLFWSSAVALGVIVLTAPWWGTVLVSHGLAPFLSALQTSDGGSFYLVRLLTLQIGRGVFFNLTVAFGLIGLLGVLAQREYLLAVWLVYPFFLDPRSANGMAMVPLSLLAAYGFDRLVAPALLSLRGDESAWTANRFVSLSMFGIAFYLFFSAAVYGLGLAEASLPAADRETMAWVDTNIPAGSDFLLLTGEQYSMNDPLQEWFPALTGQHSLTTLQGAEWTLGADFFPFYGELVALQHCADVACIESWSERTGLTHQYLLIEVLPAESSSPLKTSLGQLLNSVQDSGQYRIVYKTENVVIFER